MSELSDLYQEVILDHTKRPRNFGKLGNANHMAVGHNPLCGDKVTIYLDVEDDVVKDIRFEGRGCAVSTASASILTESVRGKTRAEVELLFERFHGLVTGTQTDSSAGAELGKLAVFAGVRKYPVRVKCATLPWHTLHAALERKEKAISTE